MNLETSKTLGGIGAILLFVGVLPFLQYLWVIGFVGAILVLAALYGLAGYYREQGIFNNALYGVITGIVGAVIAGVLTVYIVLASLLDFIYLVYPDWDGDWASLSGLTPNTNINPADIFPFLGSLLLVVAIVWIFAIIAAFFVRRSLKLAAKKTDVGLFGTSGLLLLIGAVLVIVGFGVILMWIAALLLAIAFFQIKVVTETAPMPPPPTSV